MSKALILNACNIPERWEDNRIMTLQASGKLMGSGALELFMRTHLDDPSHSFSGTGTIYSMPLQHLNPFIEKQVFITVQQGTLEKYSFSFTANREYSSGEAELEYSGLKLGKLTNYENVAREKPKTGLLVLAGNTLVPIESVEKPKRL